MKRRTDLPGTPWRLLFRNPAMLALISAQVGHNWGLFIIINDLPKYMNDVLRFSIKKNGLYTSLPYACMWIVAIFSGFLSDYLVSNKKISTTNSRKLFTSVGKITSISSINFITEESYQCTSSRHWTRYIYCSRIIFWMQSIIGSRHVHPRNELYGYLLFRH